MNFSRYSENLTSQSRYRQKRLILKKANPDDTHGLFIERDNCITYVSVEFDSEDNSKASLIALEEGAIDFLASLGIKGSYIYVLKMGKSRTMFTSRDGVVERSLRIQNDKQLLQSVYSQTGDYRTVYCNDQGDLDHLKASSVFRGLIDSNDMRLAPEMSTSDWDAIAERYRLVPVADLWKDSSQQKLKAWTIGSLIATATTITLATALHLSRETIVEPTTRIVNDYMGYEEQHRGLPMIAVLKNLDTLIHTVEALEGVKVDSYVFERAQLKAYYVSDQNISLRGAQVLASKIEQINWELSQKPYFTLDKAYEVDSEEIVKWHQGRYVDAEDLFAYLSTILNHDPRTTFSLNTIVSTKDAQIINANITGTDWLFSDLLYLRKIVAESPMYVGNLTLKANESGTYQVNGQFNIVGEPK